MNEEKPKYGTLEYKLQQVQEKLNEAVEAANLLRQEQGKIAEIPHKIQGSTWPSTNNGLSFGSTLKQFHPSYGNTYFSFDEKREDHVNQALANAEEKAKTVLALAEQRHKENEPAIENNEKCREKVFNFLKGFGIRSEKWNQVKGGRSRKNDWVPCDFIKEINEQIPINDGYKTYVDSVNIHLHSVREAAKKYLAEIAKIKAEQDKKLRESEELADAILYCRENNIDIADAPPQNIINAADNHATAKYIQENYPDGKVVEHSCCDNCSEWTVGERRCSCGNRRLNLVVDGERGSYYTYVEAY